RDEGVGENHGDCRRLPRSREQEDALASVVFAEDVESRARAGTAAGRGGASVAQRNGRDSGSGRGRFGRTDVPETAGRESLTRSNADPEIIAGARNDALRCPRARLILQCAEAM